MEYKAIVFDLFEILITEWGHKKYTKNEMCSDMGIEREIFDKFWDEKEKDGGSNELEGAQLAGMKAIQIKWYTNQHPNKRDGMAGFLTAEEPFDILKMVE